jgi:hypothetical protein
MIEKEIDPKVAEWEKRLNRIKRSWLSVCRAVDPPIHHSLVARWRSGETRPTLRTFREFEAALVYAERRFERDKRKAARDKDKRKQARKETVAA